MSWIHTIPYSKATGQLKKIYNRIKGPKDTIDNVLTIHSLRPHTLTAHMSLYKSVLHHSGNSLPKWYLEALGVYTSYLNKCDYCFEHHFAGFSRLLGSDTEAKKYKNAVLNDALEDFLDSKWLVGAYYTKRLTLEAHKTTQEHIEALRKAGFSDGEILEINQVVSYFNYVNRSVVGLGVNTKGDILGLSPNDNDDPDNWSHN
ncbi:carboxymuconolactone decarboxylase family protein [uncultured Croceitalea sp.]|uniref:carboxymuconolactone decarboxylase family protein n=1 Tax=uncultured Croceitalea sp. TaxID=1798908 RepID=UPI00374F7DF9